MRVSAVGFHYLFRVSSLIIRCCKRATSKAMSLALSWSYCLGREAIRRSTLVSWFSARLSLAEPPPPVGDWFIVVPL